MAILDVSYTCNRYATWKCREIASHRKVETIKRKRDVEIIVWMTLVDRIFSWFSHVTCAKCNLCLNLDPFCIPFDWLYCGDYTKKRIFTCTLNCSLKIKCTKESVYHDDWTGLIYCVSNAKTAQTIAFWHWYYYEIYIIRYNSLYLIILLYSNFSSAWMDWWYRLRFEWRFNQQLLFKQVGVLLSFWWQTYLWLSMGPGRL